MTFPKLYAIALVILIAWIIAIRWLMSAKKSHANVKRQKDRRLEREMGRSILGKLEKRIRKERE